MAYKNPPKETQFKKGQSGNPAGKPPGTLSFTSKVRAALEKIAMTKDGEDVSYEQLLVKRVLNKAIEQGDGRMIELIWGYLDGKPSQQVGFDEGTLQLIFDHAFARKAERDSA